MNRKGQGALEYLLLIGGALIVAAIVLTVLPALAQKGETTISAAASKAQCNPYTQAQCADYLFTDFDNDEIVDCGWDATSGSCMPCTAWKGVIDAGGTVIGYACSGVGAQTEGSKAAGIGQAS